ncbi:BRO family protein [Rhodobacter maris]|uniref:BRO family protein n=1 Tax=Rhodobacter maris TaxID=446682 RepID=UPI0037449880
MRARGGDVSARHPIRPVRTVTIDGEPWFVARDVCDVLGYADAADAIARHCKGGRETRYPYRGRPSGDVSPGSRLRCAPRGLLITGKGRRRATCLALPAPARRSPTYPPVMLGESALQAGATFLRVTHPPQRAPCRAPLRS